MLTHRSLTLTELGEIYLLPVDGIGRHIRLKPGGPQGRAGSTPVWATKFMYRFNKHVDGNWFEIVAWGHKSDMLQLNGGDDPVLWLPEDPIKAAQLLRQAADIIEHELAPIIEEYKRTNKF